MTRTFELNLNQFIAYKNYLHNNHFSYSTRRIDANTFAITVTNSAADCPSPFDSGRGN